VGEYSSVWPEICRVLSQIQWRFWSGISGKNYFGRIFRIFVQTKAILYLNLWNFALLSEILFRVRIAPKKFTQVPSYVVCTQVRRHVYKEITERRYGVEKPGRFVLGKPVLFTLGLRLTTPYSFGYFGLKFLPDVRHCVNRVMAEIWAQDSSHKIGNKFFIHHWQGRKEGSFVCETVCFFFVGEYSSIWPEICRVLSQIQWRFLRGISGKNHFGGIF